MIFDEATLRKINRLTLVASRIRSGVMRGDRRSRQRGSSLEFADYRNYTPGDDLRRVDWNAYARLDRPFLKLFEEEEDLAVYLLLDTSRSMDWGDGEQNKFRYTLYLAAAFGSIALSNGDRLRVEPLSPINNGASFGPVRGQPHFLRLLAYLQALTARGVTDLNQSLRDFALAGSRPGLVVVLSDLFSPNGYQDGLTQVLGRGHEVGIIHLLAPSETDPPLAGDLRLVDVETGRYQEVSLDAEMRQQYRQRVLAWQAEIRAHCRNRGIRYLGLSTAQPWEKAVLQEMRRAGVVR